MDRGQLIAAVAAIWGLTLAAVVGIFGSLYVGIALAVVSIGGPTAAIWIAKGMNHKPGATPPPVKNTPA
jgi:hypothetical protein